MDRLARIMEYFWLTIGIVSALWTAWQVHLLGWADAKVYTWFPMVCLAMFFYRRFTRKKMAQWAERQASQKKVGE